MISKKEFDLLNTLRAHPKSTQREIAAISGMSLGGVNKRYKTLEADGLIVDGALTQAGQEALEPYRVNGAIILAAGMSTRFAPLSYEVPKGLIKVKGEVLIERQIRQLKEAGVENITIVLGHMMEKFLYLKDKYGLNVVINPDYRTKNTHSSLFHAREFMNGTYVCCADNYFLENPFSKYEYRSFYTTEFMPGVERGERGVFSNKEGLITETCRPSVDQYALNGACYMNPSFCRRFVQILEDEYGKPGTDQLYWEQMYAAHVKELPLYEKRLEGGEFLEFDAVKDLEAFDPDYILHNELKMTRNIVEALGCTLEDIKDLRPMMKGLTNSSFMFTVNGERYVYRTPGMEARSMVDRRNEQSILQVLNRAGISDLYVYEDPEEGWMISRYVPQDELFSFKNPVHVQKLADLLKQIHSLNYRCGRDFSYFEAALRLIERIRELDPEAAAQAEQYVDIVREIQEDFEKLENGSFMAHNDIYEDNLLLSKGRLYLIDWEYAGNCDPAFDICKLFVKIQATGDDIDKALEPYYGKNIDSLVRKHLIEAAVISYFHWFVWAMFMVKYGKDYVDYEMTYFNDFRRYLNELGKDTVWKS